MTANLLICECCRTTIARLRTREFALGPSAALCIPCTFPAYKGAL